jgi:hypothetical protein
VAVGERVVTQSERSAEFEKELKARCGDQLSVIRIGPYAIQTYKTAARPASRRATGTRNGEQET